MTSYYLPSESKIGVGYQAHALANALTDHGDDVTVFSGCRRTQGARYATVTIPLAGSGRTFRFALCIRRLDLSSFDILHAHGDDYWLWKHRVPHLRTMHGSCLDEALHITGAKERVRMLALGISELMATVVADQTVCVSPGTRRRMPWVRTVVPNGVDRRVFHPSDQKSAHPSILFVGTYRRRKRGSLLMRVFHDEVRRVIPDAELWMVSEDAPPATGVTVLGRVDELALADLYQKAWVFCLPSSYEGFGIPYAEALASGTPAVATPNPGAEYVLAGGAGVITRSEDLGEELINLLQSPQRRQTQAQAGYLRSEVFDLEAVVARYKSLYASLIERKTADAQVRNGLAGTSSWPEA
jgi:glycosyltransferase involved in cell wall biosynthesis